MKRYQIRVSRDYQFFTFVDAEDSREARFEAVKHLAFKLLKDFVPLNISEGEEVFRCDTCTAFFPQRELTLAGEKLLCEMCSSYERGEMPDIR